jgi:NAD(P)-dependent dehydrogenase (short-subunit alcohol dehydrogenase family)
MKPVSLITGAARGIGRGIAEALAKEGFDIVIADILSKDDAREAIASCEKLGAKVLFVQSDISKADSRIQMLNTIKKEMGRLDILVNNAGVAPKVRTDILEATEESFDRVMTINLKGPYFLTQLVANWMIEQKKADPSRTPMIINIASNSAYTSSTGRGEYCVSKAGISMMTKLYADRLSEFGINVYEIRPGIIKTDMTAGVKEKYDNLIFNQGITPLKRWGLPEDIAKACVAFARGYLPYSTGEVVNVDGGFHLRRL